ncbi:hypothetical protein PRZ48_013511 [Zasmidium cellare]|uniref:Methyltransferase domain-containing protein n=1 Tax=Zasmidium cellare TaxID=395010 RepID=A0ABR0E1A0_ZASCE|nr:hypothetical protein PRZ48_013511 [Zasmidium cellare]
MKKPFEEKWHGYFDVVHVRLVQAAIQEEKEWELMMRNVTRLLKPGGWLQWVESDRAVSVRHALRPVAPPLAAEQTTYRPPSLEHLASLNRSMMPDTRAQAMNHGFMNLDVLMARESLQDVLCDGYVLDRQDDGGKFRRELAEMGIVTVRSMLKARGEEGLQEEWAEKAREEVERGAHFVTRMKVFVGRKGLDAV